MKENFGKYQFIDNSFSMIANDDILSKVDLEIGDTKQPKTFYPQVKVKRWDNEVNLSARLIADGNFQLITDEGKIKYANSEMEANFYELPISDELKEGGYEFDITLHKKPQTNKIRFSLQTKELDFYYQPPLNEGIMDPDGVSATANEIFNKDGNVLSYRPENIVGSYVAYHKKRPTNYSNGKVYKTGQAFIIHRPRIEDSAGNKVWGELSIKNDELVVTIPQEFLNKAVYPIRHSAGLRFGYETVGSTGYSAGTRIWGILRTSGVAGVADSISLYTTGAQGDPFHVGLYQGTTRIAKSAVVGNEVVNDWVVVNLNGETIAASTGYYICFARDAGVGLINTAYNTVAPNLECYGNVGSELTWDNPITWGATNYTNDYSIYCTYSLPATTFLQPRKFW